MEPVIAIPSPSRLQNIFATLASMRSWPIRRWLVATAAALLAALVIGVPTGIVETSFYTRMLPVTWWDYPIWAISALLIGAISGTYVRARGVVPATKAGGRRTIGASLLSAFAVGCPICNKLIVAAIGVSGALTYWAPLQPVLGVLSLALLLTALVVRLRGQAACPLPSS